MSTPADHAHWLRQPGYPVPPAADLTPAERDLLAKFGHWMHALTTGAITPVTPDQERFLQVARGDEPPASPFEVAWAKVQRFRAAQDLPVSPLELTRLFERLEAARAAGLAAQQRVAFRKLDVMAKVQPELDAIDAETAPELKSLTDEAAAAEAAVRQAVLAYGRSFYHCTVKATYSRGRVTFDNKSLQVYAESHPDINRFKKVGQPVVSLRYEATVDSAPPPDEIEEG
jgi:hypothetical protein